MFAMYANLSVSKHDSMLLEEVRNEAKKTENSH